MAKKSAVNRNERVKVLVKLHAARQHGVVFLETVRRAIKQNVY